MVEILTTEDLSLLDLEDQFLMLQARMIDLGTQKDFLILRHPMQPRVRLYFEYHSSDEIEITMPPLTSTEAKEFI